MINRGWRRQVPALLAAAVMLVPLVIMVAGSLRPAGQPPQGLGILPSEPTLEAYRRLPDFIPVLTYLVNSTVVTLAAVALTVLVASWAGFGIRLLPRRARRTAILASLLLMLVPVTAVWTTRFALYRSAGVIDTWVPLLAPALAATSPFFVLVYAWSFTGIRDNQFAAARLEGASAWRMWRALAMPQAKPATLAVAILAFTAHWANFIDPLLYLDSQALYTLPIGLRTLQLLNPTDFPLLLAGAVLATLPPVIVFLLAQRRLLDDPLRRLREVRR